MHFAGVTTSHLAGPSTPNPLHNCKVRAWLEPWTAPCASGLRVFVQSKHTCPRCLSKPQVSGQGATAPFGRAPGGLALGEGMQRGWASLGLHHTQASLPGSVFRLGRGILRCGRDYS